MDLARRNARRQSEIEAVHFSFGKQSGEAPQRGLGLTRARLGLEEQRAAKAAQDAADAKRIADQQAKDRAATWAAQQATLRAQYDGPAKAAVSAIVADVTRWGQGQRGPVGVDYPDYAAWLAEMKADHWEIVTADSDVQDYGTSDFKRDATRSST